MKRTSLLFILWLSLLGFLAGVLVLAMDDSPVLHSGGLLKAKEAELAALKAEGAKLQEEQLALKARQEALYETYMEEADPALVERMQRLRLWSGMEAVQGAGVLLSLNDKKGYSPTVDKACSLVHDIHLRHMVQVLIDAGAQAISINEERILANTALRCAGSTILVNQKRLTPPYVFKAIGAQDALFSALESSELLQALSLDPCYLQVDYKREDLLVLEGFDDASQLSYAIDRLKVHDPKTE